MAGLHSGKERNELKGETKRDKARVLINLPRERECESRGAIKRGVVSPPTQAAGGGLSAPSLGCARLARVPQPLCWVAPSAPGREEREG